MRHAMSLFLGITAIFLGACGLSNQRTVSITRAAPTTNDTVSVERGRYLKVTLPMSAGTGYAWRISSPLPADGLLSLSEHKPSVTLDDTQRVGGSVAAVFTFIALHTGEQNLEFDLSRPWAKEEPPVDRYTLSVTVTP